MNSEDFFNSNVRLFPKYNKKCIGHTCSEVATFYVDNIENGINNMLFFCKKHRDIYHSEIGTFK